MSLALLTGRIEKVEARLASMPPVFRVEGPIRAAPATDAEAAAVEASLAVTLPRTLRELYTRFASSYRLRWSFTPEARATLEQRGVEPSSGGFQLLSPPALVERATRDASGAVALVPFALDGAGRSYALDYARALRGAPRISAVEPDGSVAAAAPAFENFIATWAERAFADARSGALAELLVAFVKSGAWRPERSKAAVASAARAADARQRWANVAAARPDVLAAALVAPEGVIKLDLERIGLEALPDAFGSLLNLRELLLTDNRLSELPASFARLVALERLQLGGNPIGTPSTLATLAALPNLRWLILTKALPERRLPEQIGALRRLESLALADNGLVELPSSLGDLGALEELTLSRNGLERLPVSSARLAALRWCFLDGNPGLDLDATFRVLAELRRLERLTFDARGEIPESLGALSQVRRVFVYGASDAARRKIKRLLPRAERIEHRR